MEFFGDKTSSLFDLWSIEHFLTGISIGALVHFFHNGRISERDHKYICIIFVLFLAYLWEVIEFYLEAGYSNIEAVTYWFQGVEFWGNRIITDPMMVLLGHLVAVRYNTKGVIWSARFLSFTWLFVHVFVFPHCMYLQELLFR